MAYFTINRTFYTRLMFMVFVQMMILAAVANAAVVTQAVVSASGCDGTGVTVTFSCPTGHSVLQENTKDGSTDLWMPTSIPLRLDVACTRNAAAWPQVASIAIA